MAGGYPWEEFVAWVEFRARVADLAESEVLNVTRVTKLALANAGNPMQRYCATSENSVKFTRFMYRLSCKNTIILRSEAPNTSTPQEKSSAFLFPRKEARWK